MKTAEVWVYKEPCSLVFVLLLPSSSLMPLSVSIAFSTSPFTYCRPQGDSASSSRITLKVIPSKQLLMPRHGAARAPKTQDKHSHHSTAPIFWAVKLCLCFQASTISQRCGVVAKLFKLFPLKWWRQFLRLNLLQSTVDIWKSRSYSSMKSLIVPSVA